MSAAVMGSGSHMKRPWEDERSLLGSNEQSTSTRRMGTAVSAELSYVATGEQRLPPISATLDRQSRLPYPESLPELQDASRFSYVSQSPYDEASKRPRLLHEGDVGRARPPEINTSMMAATNIREACEDIRSQESQTPRPWIPGPGGDLVINPGCPNCSDTKDLIQKVVSGLLKLEVEIRQAIAESPVGRTSKEDMGSLPNEPAPGHLGLKNSLAWASDSIQTNMRLARDLAASRSGLPPFTGANPVSPPHHEHFATNSALVGPPKRSLEDKHRLDDNSNPYSPSSDAFPRSLGHGYLSMMSSEPPRRGFPVEQTPTQLPQSPHRSSASSVFGSGQSPVQMQPDSRTLPSPSSLQLHPLPGNSLRRSFSPSVNQSAHAAHLQDLQHQISTKTLALQTLQREHDQLLAAFSRSQIRCSTLDKKSQVSDHEINSLTEEKIRLQSQVEALEIQVEDLLKARDEVHKQHASDGAQWRQIMAMSSQLQAHGAEEMKRYKSDRELWERDREGLQRRIQDLESGTLTGMDHGGSGESETAATSQDILSSTSLDLLRQEVVRLRRTCADMETALQALRREAHQMDRLISELVSMRDRISTTAQQGLQDELAMAEQAIRATSISRGVAPD